MELKFNRITLEERERGSWLLKASEGESCKGVPEQVHGNKHNMSKINRLFTLL